MLGFSNSLEGLSGGFVYGAGGSGLITPRLGSPQPSGMATPTVIQRTEPSLEPNIDVALQGHTGEGINTSPLSWEPKKCADHREDVDATQKNQNEQFFDCKADDKGQDPPIEVEGASEDLDLEHAHSFQMFPQAQNVAITNSNFYTVSSGISIVFGEPSEAVNSVHHHHHHHHHYHYRQNKRRRLGRRFTAD